MSALAATATDRRSLYFLDANAGAAGRAATTPDRFSIVYLSTRQDETYEEHLAGLTPLDALLDELRAKHAGFDAALAVAEEESYARYLARVREGAMSRLHAERLRAKLTQGELAAMAGLRQPNVSRLEKVGAAMSVRTARRLAAALQLDDYRVLLP